MSIPDIEIKLPLEYRSGNGIPVERAVITRTRMIEILQDAVEADRQSRTIFVNVDVSNIAPGK